MRKKNPSPSSTYHSRVDNEKTNSSSMMHKCNLCDKTFNSEKTLDGHKTSHRSKLVQPPIKKRWWNDTYDDQQILSAADLTKYSPPRSRETKKRCGKSIIDYEAINVAQILCEISRADHEILKLSTDIDNQINNKLVTTVKDNNKSLVVRFKFPKDKKIFQTHHEDCN
ncbi:uncharacterized protein [Cicer arietinum]|uniref:Uncharacterized protein LOC101489273 n=1 Tax=Cicer arietinum TaxID=3827 RepID=A0A1S2Z2J0_CICAR|nr:uncharacterized protein LOC101489273 [Cicer arietinum]